MQIPYPCNNEIDDIVELVISQAKRCIKCNRILKPDLLLGFFDVCHNKECEMSFKNQKGVRRIVDHT